MACGTGPQPAQPQRAKQCQINVTKKGQSQRKNRSKDPVATIAPDAQTLRIVHGDQNASRLGIHPGQTLADAKAIAPNLTTYHDNPAADRRQIESLALWADRFSPIVHIEGDDTLILDTTGCERLFHGEENLLRLAIEGLSNRGFSARGAVADTPGAAWALAHAHPNPAAISKPGQIAADLAPLPVWSLRVNEQVTKSLALVGVVTLASLFHLPRSSLASRFSEELLRRIDQALGNIPEVPNPYHPQPTLTSRIHFGAPTTRLDTLIEAVHRALDPFCRKLARQMLGVRQMFLTFYCPDVPAEQGTQTRTVTLPVDLSQPTRSQKHLRSLLAVTLDKLTLPAPTDSLVLWAKETDPLDDWQDELFNTDSSDGRELSNLLDRLATRLGPQTVVRPEPLSDHQPERAFQYVSLVGEREPTSPRPATRAAPRAAGFSSRGRPQVHQAPQTTDTPRRLKPAAQEFDRENAVPNSRPLRLSPHPVEVAATAIVPDGPPIAFRLNGTQHTVVDSVGPERIETGWWRGPHLKRDYYRVTTKKGQRFWLFRQRDTRQWFLHGWFD